MPQALSSAWMVRNSIDFSLSSPPRFLHLDLFFFFFVASLFIQKRMCFIYPTFLRGMLQEMFILMISETYDSSYFNKDSIKTILHWVAIHI